MDIPYVRWIDPGWDFINLKQAQNVDMRALVLVARLSSMVLNPLGFVQDRASFLAPLSSAAVGKIAERPAFAAPFNKVLLRALSYDTMPLTSAMYDRFVTDPRSRLSALCVTASTQLVVSVALLMAGAILHRKVVGLMLKAERGRAQRILGEDAFQLATQEAPMLHPVLAELDITKSKLMFSGAGEEGQVQHQVIMFGVKALCRFIDSVEPALVRLFTHRFSRDLLLDERHLYVKAFEPLHCEHIVKLFRRRLPSWSDFIG